MGLLINPPPAATVTLADEQLAAALAAEEKRSHRIGAVGLCLIGTALLGVLAFPWALSVAPGVLVIPGAMGVVAGIASVAGLFVCAKEQSGSMREVQRLKKAIAEREEARAAELAALPPGPGADLGPSLSPVFEAAIAQEMAEGTADAIRVNKPLQFAKKPQGFNL